MGDVVPADVKLFEGSYLNVDKSVLTVESLPVSKCVADVAYSSSLVRLGKMMSITIGTGRGTIFGKTAALKSETAKTSGMQYIIIKVFYVIVGTVRDMDTVTFVDGILIHANFLEDRPHALILLVAAISIVMPVVLTAIITLGMVDLVKKYAVLTCSPPSRVPLGWLIGSRFTAFTVMTSWLAGALRTHLVVLVQRWTTGWAFSQLPLSLPRVPLGDSGICRPCGDA